MKSLRTVYDVRAPWQIFVCDRITYTLSVKRNTNVWVNCTQCIMDFSLLHSWLLNKNSRFSNCQNIFKQHQKNSGEVIHWNWTAPTITYREIAGLCRARVTLHVYLLPPSKHYKYDDSETTYSSQRLRYKAVTIFGLTYKTQISLTFSAFRDKSIHVWGRRPLFVQICFRAFKCVYNTLYQW